MIEFIKSMAEAYGWSWTIAILIYVTFSAIVAVLVSYDILFGVTK